jgi:hypothetical protein
VLQEFFLYGVNPLHDPKRSGYQLGVHDAKTRPGVALVSLHPMCTNFSSYTTTGGSNTQTPILQQIIGTVVCRRELIFNKDTFSQLLRLYSTQFNRSLSVSLNQRGPTYLWPNQQGHKLRDISEQVVPRLLD